MKQFLVFATNRVFLGEGLSPQIEEPQNHSGASSSTEARACYGDPFFNIIV